MASIQIPDGFIAVTVLVPRGDGEVSVKITGTIADDAEHEYIAEAIKALAEEQVDITDDLIEEDAEPEPEGDDEGEEEDEKEEPEPDPS